MISIENFGLAEAPLRYNRAVGPLYEVPDETISMMEVIEVIGINCQLLAHWALEELCALTLPKDYLSSHIWADTVLTRFIDLAHESLYIGDIVFFARDAVSLPQDLHLAVVIAKTTGGEPLLLHCVRFKDTQKSAAEIWTLTRFKESRFHNHFYGAKRVTGRVLLSYAGVAVDAPPEYIAASPFPGE